MQPALKSAKKSSEEIDLSRLLEVFRKRWWIVAITFCIALALAKVYLRYSQQIYEAYATLEVVEPNSQLRSFGILRDIDDYTDNINSEIEIIQSRRIVEEAVRTMEFMRVSYFAVGRVKITEMYKRSPIFVELDTTSIVPWGLTFDFDRIGERKFKLTWGNDENEWSKEGYFGEPMDINGFKFTIFMRKPPEAVPFEPSMKYQFRPNQIESIIGRAAGGLKVEQMGYNGSMIKISCQDHVPGFAADFVNALTKVYVAFDKSTKAQAAQQALQFIDEQIDSLENSVNNSSSEIQFFRDTLNLVTIEDKAARGTTLITLYEARMRELEMRSIAIDSLEKYLRQKPDQVVLGSTLSDIEDPLLMQMVQSYNDMVLEYKTLLQNYTPQHPKCIELNARIREVRNSILENVETVKANNSVKLSVTKTDLRKAEKILDSIPRTQRRLDDLTRKHDVHRNALISLGEKQIDAEINLRSIVSNINPIDKALEPSWPINPVPRKVYTLAGGAGISVGVIIVVILALTKTTISTKEEVEAACNTPVIGMVKRSSSNLQHKYPRVQIMENSKSSLSESIRSIRTNLQFIAPDKKCKIISITSTMSGEGKSFITINLAGIISLLNKKVVILDLDLRKPKLHYSFGRDNTKGLSNYLVGKCDLNEILQRTEYEYLDIITSGPIPPNPAELIQSQRMENLIKELSETYDYILVDTPPVGLVTDGVTLLKMSDVSLYVLRADYSQKSYANIPDRLAEEQKVQNLYIVLNSVAQTGGRYTGYGYKIYSAGYYSEEDEKAPWWQIWKRVKFKRR